MTSRRYKKHILVVSVFASMVCALASTLSITEARLDRDVLVDRALGIGFVSLPSGWSVAPPGKYTPGTIGLIKGLDDVRLSVQPLGLADTRDEATAASTEADRLAQGLRVPITRTPVIVAGSRGVMLQGLPGPANVQIVLAHQGALYNIVAFDNDTLQQDQLQALASLHFVSRVGSFPSSTPPAPQGTHEFRTVHLVNVGPQPSSIPGGIHLYVFWGNAISGHCGSQGGALATGNWPTCGGYFYGQGDHHGQDAYAIDWALNTGNTIFSQGGSGTVVHAGWVQGSFYGYGIWVVVNYGSGVYGYYAHMNDISVSVGQGVNYATGLGHSGCTGNCSGPHVHVAWVMNPSLDSYGQPYNGTAEPQTPLYTLNANYPVYSSLTPGELVNGY